MKMTSFAAAAALALGSLANPVGISILAQEPAPAAAKAELPEAKLPLKRVVLFSSGVGFFEHRGNVQDSAHVDLKFNVDDVNDLLKSMVVLDEGNGQVNTVSYGSKDPITKTLKTFAIDLTTNPTFSALLNQVRGEKVQIDSPNPITGIIVGTETRVKVVDNNTITMEVLNLLTEEGLRSVDLAEVGRIKLLNEALDAEFRQALSVLALGHATDKKTVTLNCIGEGERPVRVGYVQESPIWKTSYRLVLNEGERPFLQGWAIVENTTEEDWQDVSLTLVSGRPISFVMNLYDPLYLTRPVVEPELYASLRPQTYGQEMEEMQMELAEAAPAPDASGGMMPGGGGGGLGGGFGGGYGDAAKGMRGRFLTEGRSAGMSMAGMAQGQSLAGAEEVGELFQYPIATPVTLERQRSAMLMIMNESVDAEKLSIYDPSVHAKHPLNGVKLKNSTDTHIMQGPVTVFDGGAYAGDAQILDLQPGADRMISYALDLDVEVAPESMGYPQTLVSLKIARGSLFSIHKMQRGQKYVIKNSGSKPKDVLIEQQIDTSWKLLEPKEPNKSRDKYRFTVNVAPGKAASLLVKEEMDLSQEFALTNLDDNTIAVFIQAPVISTEVKTALNRFLEIRSELRDLQVLRTQFDSQIAAITQEQDRIRQNMAQLDRNNDLYARYVKKFDEQETQVEKTRAKIMELDEKIIEKSKELDNYVLSLDIG